MEAKARLRYLHMSPKKVRLVVDLIRGLNAKQAVLQLQSMRKKAKQPVLKLLNSAISNAKNNFKMNENSLVIKSVFVDQGPTMKRWTPKAFGRAGMIQKKTSHITIVLTGNVQTGIKLDKKVKAKTVNNKKTDVKKGSVKDNK